MTHTTDFSSKLKPTEPVKQVTAAEVQRKWDMIEQSMESCGAKGTMIQAVPGPRVTRFELEISKADAKKLCKQLGQSVSANSLLARWTSENLLSLEIPNDVPQTVSAYELFHSDQWKNTQMTLPIMLGMGDNYTPVILDLATAPHLLIGGCTGTGKSVCMQMVLASLMQKHSPEELKFLICDMKAVEFTWMSDSPYLMRPVITDIEQALDGLDSLEKEMKRRFQLLAKAEVRNIAEYNAKGNEPMPYLIAILDEFSDFMYSEKHQTFKQLVNGLASRCRCVGIHIILSTQRPDVRVFPLELRASFPIQIAFKVASRQDSQTIIEETGAEKLLGHGDMLLKTPASVVRLQVGYLPHEELALFASSPENDVSKTTKADDETWLQNHRETLHKAIRLVIESRKTNTSYLQRRLVVGYNEACRLMETMETYGIVSSVQENGSRRILVDTVEEALKRLPWQN